ncbi:MAG: hypothetical protein GKR86_00010 [Ilumatobacter sp.]|nr:hypothetical protein [Ilumatobacter sp.]
MSAVFDETDFGRHLRESTDAIEQLTNDILFYEPETGGGGSDMPIRDQRALARAIRKLQDAESELRDLIEVAQIGGLCR